jgi:hypothetical protein
MIAAMTNQPPKSAVELALERLRRQDAEQGVSERSLTDDQKAEIADIRRTYAARLAQEEILFTSKMRATFDPVERQTLDEHYRRDVRRLNDERDRKIEKVRQAGDGEPAAPQT